MELIMKTINLSRLTLEDYENLEQFSEILTIGFERYIKEVLKEQNGKGVKSNVS
jgi:hypothetical protein